MASSKSRKIGVKSVKGKRGQVKGKRAKRRRIERVKR